MGFQLYWFFTIDSHWSEEHDLYIEASQVEMLYYINDEVNKDWKIVVNLKPKDFYDMGEGDINVFKVESCLQQDLNQFFNVLEQLALFRDDKDDDLLSENNINNELIENDSMQSNNCWIRPNIIISIQLYTYCLISPLSYVSSQLFTNFSHV